MKDKHYYSDGTTSEKHDFAKTLHRVGEPAIEKEDRELWYFEGKLHRENGPAVECFNGVTSYYLGGEIHDMISYYAEIEEVAKLPLEFRLIDPREWVRRNAVSSNNQRDRK